MAGPARGSSARALALAALAAALAPPAGAATMGIEPDLVPFVVAQVHRAADRLVQAPCSQLLTDFRDSATGRTLADVLADSNVTPAGYVEDLLYRAGPADGPCRESPVSAYTSPGSRVVYVCPRRFRRLRTGADRNLPVTILIHAALHTLGLSETPPTSEEITERVEARCGR